MTNKKSDLLVLILFWILGILYVIITQDLFINKPLFAFVTFMAPPVIYLSIREKKPWKKILIATFIFGVLFGFFFEFIAELNRAYSVISRVFPKLLGIVPLDNVLGHAMMTFLTLIFYEHFIIRNTSNKISKKTKFVFLGSLLVIFIMISLFLIQENLLRFPYPYFFMGLVAISLPLYLGFKKPTLIPNMSVTGIYFFFLYFIVELFAVQYNWWIFPGNNYIGFVTIFGQTFPFEELFFWMLFYAPSLVSYYEIFVNNNGTASKH